MLFERIESEGLAHFSYILGDQNEAVVIDPRRDCDIYIEVAASRGMKITHILETHRNEDYVIGSIELSHRTGAAIWHADPELKYAYGIPAAPGQTWKAGRLTIEAMSTPGHTPGSLSYVLYDPGGVLWMIFTGDCLFAGDVGRVDLLGTDQVGTLAGLLYDSIFQRIIPLGDSVIVCPAHGSGSVCGTSISDRIWTTIGIERIHNPRLRIKDRMEFVRLAAAEGERPPYFRRMEVLNLTGAPLPRLPEPSPLGPVEFADAARGAVVIDTRSELAFSAAHVPGAQFLWLEGLASFAGWFLPYDRTLLLISDPGTLKQATRMLVRIGYDDVKATLAGGMLAWHMAGQRSESIATITVQELCRRLDRGENPHILDVRSADEIARARIPGAQEIHVTMLIDRMIEVPKDRTAYIFCGSGMRSMVAASLLKRNGWEDLTVVLGGLAGWKSAACPLGTPG